MTARVKAPLGKTAASRLARRVIASERARVSEVSIAFVGPAMIRRLNAEHLGHDRTTDVIAFGLTAPDGIVGDVYICPAVATQNARAAGVRAADEMRRLVVHGVLHVLGYDHPAGERRMSSPMWRRQERYLRRFAS